LATDPAEEGRDKASWRQLLLARRDAESDRAGKSRAIAARVLALPELENATHVFAYVGVRSEVATLELLEHLVASGRSVGVPRRVGDDLEFAVFRSQDALRPAGFGLLEPLPATPSIEAATASSVVLVPGVGFDRRGGRLGYGRGYFDRWLRRPGGNGGEGRPRIGLAFECQVVEWIPMEPSDVSMDGLVTEAATYRFSEPAESAGR